MSDLMTTTYSMWRLFRNCRMACKWRYIDELVPLERDPNLAFGSVIHDCLECWHGERDLAKVLDHIDRTYPTLGSVYVYDKCSRPLCVAKQATVGPAKKGA